MELPGGIEKDELGVALSYALMLGGAAPAAPSGKSTPAVQCAPGQSKGAAKRAIAKYEVLGPYSGLLSEQDAYIKTRGRSVLGLIEHERFALSIDKPLRGRDAFATLVIDPWPGLGEAPRGSPLIACNDCRADPYHSLARNYEPANCAFVNAYVRGFAHVFVVATRDVRPGDELLIDYKESY